MYMYITSYCFLVSRFHVLMRTDRMGLRRRLPNCPVWPAFVTIPLSKEAKILHNH